MRFFVLLLSLAGLATAQVTSEIRSDIGQYSAPWFGTPSYFKRNFFHQSHGVTLQPPVKLKDFVVDGKLVLSLRNYLDLVVANNTDIGIQRVQLELPKNSIQRALGVFDPLLTSSFSATRSERPATNQLQGAQVVSSLTQPFQARYTQLTPFSTSFFSNVSVERLSTNDQFTLFNPAFTTTWSAGFTQPLLRGRGKHVTMLPITIAKAQKASQDQGFYDQVMRLMVTAENAYWDLVNSRENLKVQQAALNLANESLARSRREVELGATSPLEIFQPEQQAATAKINVNRVEFQLLQFQDILRRQIGADLDPAVRELPIELTEVVDSKIDETPFKRDEMVTMALDKRPDLRVSRLNLDVNDLQIDSAMNTLRPQLNLQAQYSTQGRGGIQIQRPPGAPVIRIPGGVYDSFGQWFDFNTFSFSLNLTLPLRDRAAAATLADSVVNKRLNALRLRNTEQTIRQEVLTAITNVESSREAVKLAQVAVDFARKRAEADQKRYDLGVINIFFLLSAQNDLTQAESNLVNQTVQYRRNLLTLQQRLGTLLEDKGIILQP